MMHESRFWLRHSFFQIINLVAFFLSLWLMAPDFGAACCYLESNYLRQAEDLHIADSKAEYEGP